MKCTIHFCLFLFSLQLLTAQIPNSDFENWDAQPVLKEWITNSYPLTMPPWDPYIVKQDTDRYSGSYAANFYGNGFLKPFATTTFSVWYHPVSLEARIKYSFPPCVNDSGFSQQDTISIVVELLNNGAVVDAGKWQYQSAGFLSSYQLLSIPVSQNSAVFDSCRITITGGNVFGGCGFAPASTQFKVDHLELKYSSSTNCIDTAQICSNCPCVGLYDPVCGCNGVTYGNSCEAYNAGVTSWTNGVCNQGACNADFTYCGSMIALSPIQFTSLSTGDDIINWRWEWNDGSFTSHDSTPTKIFTTDGSHNVCLYITSIQANQDTCIDSICGLIFICAPINTGPCVDSNYICNSCNCFPAYVPVMGCNGVVYNNSCEANKAGVTSWVGLSCNDSCQQKGVVVQGVECLLVQDFQSNTFLMPCSLPTGASLHLGDTVAYSYTASNCMSFCMQGTYVDFTCFDVLWASDTTAPSGSCHAEFSFSKNTDTVSFINTSTAANITNYLWSFGDGGSSALASPVHVYTHDSTYTVCLYITGFDSSGNPCTDQFCRPAYITHGCIDTSLICPPGSLCCDAPLYEPVCGCDSVTYDNACVATLWHGVTGYMPGPCITGISEINTVLKNLSIQPNPATNNAELQFDLLRASRVVIQITDMLGAVVAATDAGMLAAGKIRLPISVNHLPAGIYPLKVSANGTAIGVKKLVKE